MMSDNPILVYQEAIENGSVTVGRWVRLAYAYIVSGLLEGRFFYSPKKANRAIQFIETFCHHCQGRNDLIRLELWQKALIAVIFGVVDKEGLRQFREIVVVMARKDGKSLLAAAIIAYVLFCDGEYGALICCVAPKLEQADIVYQDFLQSVKMEPELNALMSPRKTDYYMASTNSSVKKVAFNSRKSDGFNPHVVICDEIASWPGDRGLKQYEVMDSAFGSRRQPFILSITTAGYENEGIYDELIKRSTRLLMGDSRETRLFPLLYMIDDVSRWNDIREVCKAVPNLGVSVREDFLREKILIAENSLSKRAEFLTKYCCIKQNSSQAWLSGKAVDLCTGDAFYLEDFRGCYCVGGIDLSKTTDLTAYGIVIEREGRLYVFMQFSLPHEKIEDAIARDNLPYRAYIQRGLLAENAGSFVDYRICFQWFVDLVEKYRIYPLKIGYDRACATYLVADMKQYGFHMDDVYQGYNLSPVIQEVEGLMSDGVLRIGDNDLLKIHLLDSAVKTEPDSGRRRLVKLATSVHIDGCAALLDAMTVRQKWYNEIGGQLQNGATG